MTSNLGLMDKALTANTAFDEIPVMYVVGIYLERVLMYRTETWLTPLATILGRVSFWPGRFEMHA